MSISGMDAAIIAVYFAGILLIGLVASRRIKSSRDFAIAGGGLRFPVMLGTLIGTSIGAAATVGKAGEAYRVGAVMFLATLGYGIGLLLFAWLAPVLRRHNLWTIPDVLDRRYGDRLRIMIAVTMSLGVVALFGGQLVATGVVLQVIFADYGLTYGEIIVLAGAIMVFYTMVGGLVAVAYTDLIQVVIMLIAIGILLPYFVGSALGPDLGSLPLVAFDAAGEAGGFMGDLSIFYILAIFCIDIPFCLIDPSLWQRAAAARNESIIRRGLVITAGIYFLWSLIIVALGVAAHQLLPGLEATDTAIPRLIGAYMPPVLKGLCLAAMIAVMMSTADTALLVSGTTISWDVARPLYPELTDKQLLLIARGFVLLVGVFGIVFALFVRGVFEVLLLAFAIFVAAGFVPVMAALFWKTATAGAAMISSICATVTVVGLYVLKYTVGLPVWLEPILGAILVSSLLMWWISRRDRKAGLPVTPRIIDTIPGAATHSLTPEDQKQGLAGDSDA